MTNDVCDICCHKCRQHGEFREQERIVAALEKVIRERRIQAKNTGTVWNNTISILDLERILMGANK